MRCPRTTRKRASRTSRDAGAAGQDAQAAGEARAAARISRRDPRRTAGGRHFRRRGDADRLRRAPRACRSTSRARSSRPAIQDNLGWGFATALGAQDARPRRAGAVDLRRRRLPLHRNEMATAVRHRIPLVGDRVRRWRLRQCAAHPAGALRQPADRQRPGQSGFRAVRRKLRRRGRARRTIRRSCAPRYAAPCGATGPP